MATFDQILLNSPVVSSVICLNKVASLGFAGIASPEISAEACRNQAIRLPFPAPHWPTRYDLGEGDIRIGQTKSVYISWNPGRIFKNLMGCLSEENELQPGLVPSHCFLPSTQNVTVRGKWQSNLANVMEICTFYSMFLDWIKPPHLCF